MSRPTGHRSIRFLDALPAYLGSKRRLLGRIAKLLPPPAEAPVLIDGFLGGGSVSLWAKARGYRVICNDTALRSVVVGEALVRNDSVRLSKQDVTRLFVDECSEPGFVERVYGGDTVPPRHARFLDGALPIARNAPGPKRALLLLLLMRFVVGLRPAGNWGAKEIIRRMSAGDWEAVNRNFLRDHVARAAEAHPLALLEPLRGKINRGVFGTGLQHEVHQGDAVAFVRDVDGSVLYADAPYAATTSYETALKPLDSMLTGTVVQATPSRFSERSTEPLEELFDAARHLPVWVISYGNAVVSGAELGALVGRFKRHVHVEEIAYTHLAGLAGAEAKARNRELLVRGWD